MDAILTYHDGTKHRVSYKVAKLANQVLVGERKPASKVHEQFCLNIASIDFIDNQLFSESLPKTDIKNIKDERIRNALSREGWSGRAKARAVSRELKRRQQSRRSHSKLELMRG